MSGEAMTDEQKRAWEELGALSLRQRALCYLTTEQAIRQRRDAEERVKFHTRVVTEAVSIFGIEDAPEKIGFVDLGDGKEVIVLEDDIILGISCGDYPDDVRFHLARECGQCGRPFIPGGGYSINSLADLGRELGKANQVVERGGEDALCPRCAPKYDAPAAREPIDRIADALEAIAGAVSIKP